MVPVRTQVRRVVRLLGVDDWRFVAEDRDGVVRELGLGWPIDSGRYFLDMAEVTYIVHKDLADVYLGESKCDLAALYSSYPQMSYAWSKFTVLLDLRERGRRAKSGYSPRELLYVKGGLKVLILVLEENTLVSASEIAEWVRSAVMREYTPVIAVVDAHGDVTYYSAGLARAEDLGRVYRVEGPARTS